MKDIDGYVTKDDLYRLISRIKRNPDVVVDDKTCHTIVNAISDMPSTDVQPVKYGKWCGYLCSECNEYADYFISGDFYFDEKPNFCPNCGADMRGDAE